MLCGFLASERLRPREILRRTLHRSCLARSHRSHRRAVGSAVPRMDGTVTRYLGTPWDRELVRDGRGDGRGPSRPWLGSAADSRAATFQHGGRLGGPTGGLSSGSRCRNGAVNLARLRTGPRRTLWPGAAHCARATTNTRGRLATRRWPRCWRSGIDPPAPPCGRDERGGGTVGALSGAVPHSAALVNPGDEVVLLEPAFDLYYGQGWPAGGVAVGVLLSTRGDGASTSTPARC